MSPNVMEMGRAGRARLNTYNTVKVTVCQYYERVALKSLFNGTFVEPVVNGLLKQSLSENKFFPYVLFTKYAR